MHTTETPKKKRSSAVNAVETLFVALIFVALIVGGVIAAFHYLEHTVHSAVHHSDADVVLVGCGIDPSGSGEGALRVTNHSSGLSDYGIKVAFYDTAGTHVGNGFAAPNQIPAHATVSAAAYGTTALTGPLTCKVTSVTRTAAP